MRKLTCLLLLAILAVAPRLHAQESEAETAVEPAPVVTPTPAEPFDVAAATRAYLDRQSPEAKERSDDYFEGGYWLQVWGLVYGLVF